MNVLYLISNSKLARGPVCAIIWELLASQSPGGMLKIDITGPESCRFSEFEVKHVFHQQIKYFCWAVKFNNLSSE